MGPFGLVGPDGARIAIPSKRGCALLALLATSNNGDRSRNWLETILWCDRPADQAKASLRKELSNLKKQTNSAGQSLIRADHSRIWLDLSQVCIDLNEPQAHSAGEFLEGLDIAGEDAFEDWLRTQRSALQQATITARVPGVTAFAPTEKIAEPLALAIAVLPLRMDPPNPELEFAVDGLGEDLINRLARLRWLPVIAHSSSAALGADPIDPQTAGLALGARYIVEGSIRPMGSRYRLNIGLCDADTSQSLWSELVEIDSLEDPEAITATLAGITAALDHRIDHSEQHRAMTAQRDNSNLRQIIWQARWHLARLTDDDLQTAKSLLDQAYAIQPASPEVLIEQAWLMVRQLWLRRGSENDIRALRKAAQKAIFADSNDARGHMIAGIAEFWLRQPLRAEGLLRRAVELNPSLVMAHAQLGSALHHTGQRHQAIEALETAKRLSPNDFDLFFTDGELAMAHLAEGNLELAAEHADASLARRAAYWSSHVAKINALVGLGRMAEASGAYGELYAAQPNFKPEFIEWLPYLDISRNDSLQDGLNQAAAHTD